MQTVRCGYNSIFHWLFIQCCCDIVIYKKFISDPCHDFRHRAPKTLWNFLSYENDKGNFYYVNDVT